MLTLRRRRLFQNSTPMGMAAIIIACGSSTVAPTDPLDSSAGAEKTETDENSPWDNVPTEVRGEPVTVPLGPTGAGADTFRSVTYTPLYPDGTAVVEQIQFTEDDGTLVTRMGARPVGRHARERGEGWFEPDRGPGRYLVFPAFYFQNRTYGLEIRDTTTAGGKKVEVYLIVNEGTFEGTTISIFRNVRNPEVRDFGWALNTGFNNEHEGGEPICHANSRDCMVDFNSNWRTSPHSPLQQGDKIELAPAERLQMPIVDDGGERYYSFEQLYVVGEGMRPWYGIAPNLDSEPLPADALLGGQASTSYNYSEEPHRAFQQMANNIGISNTQRFVRGRRLFHTSFVDGTHSEHPEINPPMDTHVGQVGERFNQASCISCHVLNGRSKPAVIGAKLDTMSFLTGSVVADPFYGLNVRQNTKTGLSTNEEGRLAIDPEAQSVYLAGYELSERQLEDGEIVELAMPQFEFEAGTPETLSVRQAPQMVGMGLLEAIDEATIIALADPDDKDQDGVRGVPHMVIDPETGDTRLGRFGWKATQARLRHQISGAFLKDMGVTTPIFPLETCQQASDDCDGSTARPSVSSTEVERVVHYLSLLGVPAQRSIRSGFPEGMRVSVEHDVQPAAIVRGSEIFAKANCSACHTTTFTTGNTHPFAELRGQTIHPYTDLLLHDMGPELADTLTEGEATPNLWRTSPLWGIGSLQYVQGDEQSVRYLHDGRARTLVEAILWHGGEASDSRTRFESLPREDRDALISFLESL